MMIDLILFSGELYIQYIVFYLYFYLAGRALVILLSRFSYKSYFIPDTILEIKSNILYPILGLIFVGNILVLLNYFIPLGSLAVKVILIIILMPNLLHVKNKSYIKSYLSVNNFFYFLVIPGVLLISSSDINFHYDAAYYHLNNFFCF